uniref:C-type lectin domain-containing protein n=1 Tax=Elaeophora elaphi TaxID=1147741 RepID=A0A0R3RRL7_9BILA
MCNTIALSTATLLLLILLSSFEKNIYAIVCTYLGERHNDGDRWVVRSAFIIECHVYQDGSWRADVVACQTPKGIEMHDGDIIMEDDVTFQCAKLSSGGYRIQKHYINRNISCEGHNFGDWWISKRNFNKTCTPTGTQIMNCLTDTGIPIALNTSVTVNGTRYNCTGYSTGLVTLTRDFPRNFDAIPKIEQFHCIVNGMRKKINETWIEDTNFIKKCNERAVIIVEACTADGFIIDLNSKLVRNGKVS